MKSLVRLIVRRWHLQHKDALLERHLGRRLREEEEHGHH